MSDLFGETLEATDKKTGKKRKPKRNLYEIGAAYRGVKDAVEKALRDSYGEITEKVEMLFDQQLNAKVDLVEKFDGYGAFLKYLRALQKRFENRAADFENEAEIWQSEARSKREAAEYVGKLADAQEDRARRWMFANEVSEVKGEHVFRMKGVGGRLYAEPLIDLDYMPDEVVKIVQTISYCPADLTEEERKALDVILNSQNIYDRKPKKSINTTKLTDMVEETEDGILRMGDVVKFNEGDVSEQTREVVNKRPIAKAGDPLTKVRLEVL